MKTNMVQLTCFLSLILATRAFGEGDTTNPGLRVQTGNGQHHDSLLIESKDIAEVKNGNIGKQDSSGQIFASGYEIIKTYVLPVLPLLGLFSALFAGLNYHTNKKRKKHEIIDRTQSVFVELPREVTLEEKEKIKEHELNFYLGNPTADPLIYVGLDLDSERPYIKRIIKLIKTKNNRWIHLPIWGGQNGKTFFLARLAQNLAQEKRFMISGNRYHVLWFKKPINDDGSQFLESSLLIEYKKYVVPRSFCFLKKKRFFVFVDDIIRSDGTDQTVEIDRARQFLQEMKLGRINVITSDSFGIVRIEESEEPYRLITDKNDFERIIHQMTLRQLISTEFANDFMSGPWGTRFYNLAHFVRLLVEKSDLDKRINTDEFEFKYRFLSYEGKEALKMVAVCSLIDIQLSVNLLYLLCPGALADVENNFNGLLAREQVSGEIARFRMGSRPLTRWLLNKKHKIQDSNALKATYVDLLVRLFSSQGIHSDEKQILALILVWVIGAV